MVSGIPVTEEDYKNLAKKRNFKWLDIKLPKNTHTKTLWQCSHNHSWNAPYSDIKQGYGCPYCAGNMIKTLKDYQSVGKLLKIEYTKSSIPINICAKTDGWKCMNCAEKYEFSTRFNDIKNGHGCPKCANQVPIKLKDYKNIGKSRGIEYISDTIPKNSHTKINGWKCTECTEKYEWAATYSNIKKGTGCMNCAGLLKKTLKDYQIVGKSLKIEYIKNIIPENSNTKIDGWKCMVCLNQFKAVYQNIKYGYGCPNCSKSRSEKLCKFYFEEALMCEFSSCRPDFLKYPKTGRNLELDGYNEEYRIAFEYQGIQHYKDHPKFFHKYENNNLEYQQEKDAWKAKRCEEMGIRLIIIPYQYNCYNPAKMRDFIYDELFKIC
jgi:hypothetical protein